MPPFRSLLVCLTALLVAGVALRAGVSPTAAQQPPAQSAPSVQELLDADRRAATLGGTLTDGGGL